jgi:hypothetical protein
VAHAGWAGGWLACLDLASKSGKSAKLSGVAIGATLAGFAALAVTWKASFVADLVIGLLSADVSWTVLSDVDAFCGEPTSSRSPEELWLCVRDRGNKFFLIWNVTNGKLLKMNNN